MINQLRHFEQHDDVVYLIGGLVRGFLMAGWRSPLRCSCLCIAPDMGFFGRARKVSSVTGFEICRRLCGTKIVNLRVVSVGVRKQNGHDQQAVAYGSGEKGSFVKAEPIRVFIVCHLVPTRSPGVCGYLVFGKRPSPSVLELLSERLFQVFGHGFSQTYETRRPVYNSTADAQQLASSS